VRCLRRHQQMATGFSNCGQDTFANANRTAADAGNLLAAFTQRGASHGKNFTRSPRAVGQGPSKGDEEKMARRTPRPEGVLQTSQPSLGHPPRKGSRARPKPSEWSPASSRPAFLAFFSAPSSPLVCCTHSLGPAACLCYGAAPFQSHIGELGLSCFEKPRGGRGAPLRNEAPHTSQKQPTRAAGSHAVH